MISVHWVQPWTLQLESSITVDQTNCKGDRSGVGGGQGGAEISPASQKSQKSAPSRGVLSIDCKCIKCSIVAMLVAAVPCHSNEYLEFWGSNLSVHIYAGET